MCSAYKKPNLSQLNGVTTIVPICGLPPPHTRTHTHARTHTHTHTHTHTEDSQFSTAVAFSLIFDESTSTAAIDSIALYLIR